MNPEKPKKGVYVDYETGLIHAPGKKPLPLVGLDVASGTLRGARDELAFVRR